ncbi:MAG: 30S ribosomal protein S2 [Candidatus Vogelbacteria bacterium]|nr:30S ribosomal protein S2 [Candidatus Vogelbacteria bacterium]
MMTESAEITQNPLVEELFASGAHYGFARSRRHPSVRQYIYGAKNSIDILDLSQTIQLMSRAEQAIEEIGAEKKIVLFVGNKKEAQAIVREGARNIGAPFVAHRWIGGTLTNFSEIAKRLKRLDEIETKTTTGELSVYTKREQGMIAKEAEKLEQNFGGIRSLARVPDAIVIVDPRYEDTAVREAQAKHVPIFAVAGSDCDISGIAYPIVANDASPSSIHFLVNRLMGAYERGLKRAALPEVVALESIEK